MRTLGLDISHWDGTVVWIQLPKEFRFVFIKATEGNYPPDHLAWQHWIGAGQEGLLRGPYHFWRFAADAKGQAKEFYDRVKWLEAEGGKSELPPVVDLEDTRAPKMSQAVRDHILVTLKEVERLFGRRPIIYTAGWWTDSWIGDCSFLRAYPLWVASYTENMNIGPYMMSIPNGLLVWTFMQWTETAEIAGIAENDECADCFNGTFEQLVLFAGGTAPPVPPTVPFKGVVTATTLNIRTGPVVTSSTIGSAKGGQQVTVYEEKNGFGRITVNPTDLWVSLSYIRKV